MTSSFDPGPRFVIRRTLGSGGFGVVYEAFDVERDQMVALKTLHRTTPEGLYRLKQEFRSLAGVRHPNLVELHELLNVGDGWFLVMDLVHGEPFHRWVRPHVDGQPETDQTPSDSVTTQSVLAPSQPRPAPPGHSSGGSSGTSAVDESRLRGALKQLCAGVAAIHRAGRVHRDLKPSNVLVTMEGRVVILDFGLVAELSPSDGTVSQDLVGTPAFMAPEQLAGQPASSASDWYTVGTMLFQALAGRLPSRPPIRGMETPQALSELEGVSPPLPADLIDLCANLLRFQPSDRLTASAILSRLDGAQADLFVPDTPVTFLVGRQSELARLEECRGRLQTGRTVVVRVGGESGMGKSSLADAFLRSASRGRALVLSGRCYERESVPFKALDGVIDSLSRFLKRLPNAQVEALLPRDARAASRLFPVLDRVDAILRSPQRHASSDDPLQARRAAFAALREMLARLSERREVVVHVDDAQWGDADSAQALADIIRGPDAPTLLILLTHRVTDDAPFVLDLHRHLTRMPEIDVVDIALGPLDEATAAQLAERLLPPGSQTPPASIAREAQGSPFFIAALARELRTPAAAGPTSVSSLIGSHVSRLTPLARAVLHIVAVAARPIAIDVVRQILAPDPVPMSTIRELDDQHLVRGGQPPGRPTVECYHDRVREAVLAMLTDESILSIHRDLAQAFLVTGGAAETLAFHFAAAGDHDRAAHFALEAGDGAARALAFEQAARHYREALQWLGKDDRDRRSRVLHRLGDALVNGGRGYDAAGIYQSLERESTGAARLELRRRIVHELLTSGHLDEGLVWVRRLLGDIGLRFPETPVGTLLALARGRAALRLRGFSFRRAREVDLPRNTLIRLDTCFSIALGLANVDTLRGAVFQTRHTLLALRAGEPERVARALAVEVAYRSIGGLSARRAVAPILDEVRRLAAEIGSPYTVASSALASGVAACEVGEWRRAARECDEASTGLGSCVGALPERIVADVFAGFCLVQAGDWREYGRRSRALVEEGRQRGNRYAEIGCAAFAYLLDLAADDPDAGEARCRAQMRDWSTPHFDMLRFWQAYGLIEVDLYRGDVTVAQRTLVGVWRALRRSLLMRVEGLHIHALYLRGRVAVALGRSGDRRALAEARRAARGIERHRAPWGLGFSEILRAGIASAERRPQAVAGHLEAARVRLVVAEMQPWLAAVSHRMRGLGVRSDAESPWFAEQLVKRPDRLSACYVPVDVVRAERS